MRSPGCLWRNTRAGRPTSTEGSTPAGKSAAVVTALAPGSFPASAGTVANATCPYATEARTLRPTSRCHGAALEPRAAECSTADSSASTSSALGGTDTPLSADAMAVRRKAAGAAAIAFVASGQL
ncbi:MAG TPA: hypothetical protein PLT07_07920, partial [Trueperaceae bacterium]|nr:hypothetical protein [Trueperaceae bacterium]